MILAFCLSIMPWLGGGVYAKENPEDVIRRATVEMYDALGRECGPDSRRHGRIFALVDEILLPHADFERMSRWVLGKYWKQASAEQRRQFTQEFKVLLVRTYAASIQSVSLGDISYLSKRNSGKTDKAVVRTEILQQGAVPLPIHYHMHRKKGRWLVYDVRIEGISLVTNYRTIFAAEIRTYGVQGLLDMLKDKNLQQRVTSVEEQRSAQFGTC